RDQMGFELLHIWQERPKTVLFVTHSIGESVLLADRVLLMSPRPGKVAMEVPIDLPRPRSPHIRTLARFGTLVGGLQEAIGITAKHACRVVHCRPGVRGWTLSAGRGARRERRHHCRDQVRSRWLA